MGRELFDLGRMSRRTTPAFLGRYKWFVFHVLRRGNAEGVDMDQPTIDRPPLAALTRYFLLEDNIPRYDTITSSQIVIP